MAVAPLTSIVAVGAGHCAVDSEHKALQQLGLGAWRKIGNWVMSMLLCSSL